MMPATPRPLFDLDPAALAPARTAFFLDFDGTLADFNDDPCAVFLPERERLSLAALAEASAGAVAVVSGRAVADIDRMLAPLKLPVAGVHGLERRDASGEVFRASLPEATLATARQRLRALAEPHPGLLVEEKPGSVALHFRRRPELEARCMDLALRLAGEYPELEMLHGKMVFELRAAGATKADAIAAFLGDDAFRGRRPFFAGDDVTDEDAFARMPELGGISVKVGGGATAAAYRAADIDAFRDWLARLVRMFNQRERASVTGD